MDASDTELRRLRAGAYENERPEVQELVPAGARRILDVGCASGLLGAALKARQGAEVVGIELSTDYAADAAARLDRVITGDVETLDLATRRLGRFDCVIAADVLEHLRDPWSVLSSLSALLVPRGTAVVSLPNVRHWETFLQLGVGGKWPRRADGIWDGSHLRWFTLRDAEELMHGAGLEVNHVSPRYRLRAGEWRSERGGRRLHRTPLAPFFVFQYVISAIKTGGSGGPSLVP